MCLPAAVVGAFSAIGALVGAAGSVVGAVGSANAGAQADAVAKENARLMDSAAADAQRRGGVTAGQIRTEASKGISKQKAVFAANGVAGNSESVLAAEADARLHSEADVETVKYNAAMEAWGLKTQAAQVRKHGAAAKAAGEVGALGEGLIGGARLAGTLYEHREDLFPKIKK